MIGYYCHTHGIEGHHINGIPDAYKLCSQAKCFVNTMMEKFGKIEDPLSNGSITRLWIKLDTRSDTLKEHLSKYFKLVELCQTMILGSIEDERIFSLVSFLKSKLRNRLDNNLVSCARLYISNYDINKFPYERALALWTSICSRRGGSNMIDSLKDFDSENELDDEDSIDKSSILSFNHLSDLEYETNTWNF